MKTTDFIVENSVIAQEADEMHADHEVQMARSQMYSAAQAAIEIHRLLKDISEMQGIEGWVASKLTLASQYLESVRDYLKYEAVSQEPEMMPFAENAANYALNKLLLEKKFKEQTTSTPTIGGLSKQTGPQGVTTSYSAGPLSVSSTARPDQSTVTSAAMDMGPGGTVRRDKGIGFDVTTHTPYQPKADDVSETKNKKLKEMATGGASSAGAVATSMSGPAGKPGTGKPKKIANAHTSKKVSVGKGIY